MKIRWLLGVMVLGLMSASARAASPFDGNWSGANCYDATVTLKVADGAVRGTMTTGREVFNISGKIAADGSFNSGWIKGQFNGTSFKGVYTRAGGAHATDAGKQCLVTAERGK